MSDTNNSPAILDYIEMLSVDQIDGVIRIKILINGVRFKRLWHKSGLYPAVWNDMDGNFGTIDLASDRSGELEAIFKAWCLENLCPSMAGQFLSL